MIIKIQDREIQVPQSWNELPLKKQLICYAILQTDFEDNFEPFELLPAKRIALAKVLLDLTDEFLHSWQEDCIKAHEEDGRDIYAAELNELLKCTDFFFQEMPNREPDDHKRYTIALTLTKCPFSVLQRTKSNKKNVKTYYSPADALDNITIYELGVTFTLFEQFMKTKKEDFAHELIATLYRPSKPPTKENKQSAYQGDRRLPYLDHEATVKKRKAHMAKLPPNVKQLIIFWFASCRQDIIKSYPNVFNSKSEGNQGGNKYGWGAVLMNLAGGLVHLNEVARQPYSNALSYLSYLEDEKKLQELKT